MTKPIDPRELTDDDIDQITEDVYNMGAMQALVQALVKDGHIDNRVVGIELNSIVEIARTTYCEGRER